MTLATRLPDSPAEWAIILAALAFYLLVRWFLSWRQARVEGRERPAQAALDEVGDDDSEAGPVMRAMGYDSYRQVIGIVVCAAVIVLLTAMTQGTLRVVLLAVVCPFLVAGMAYIDFRKAREVRAKRQSKKKPSGHSHASRQR
ncbi:hypothetical protein G6045_37810 [Streptomyces sp. YC504]|uniref:Uncharacterized protein n=1 Tax=Streptomyces mesophilus TaxID=1775132 RepID=A0A6G4XUW5_9ACTN|nr:hypothetical protein [Streptomyces mesophilus]NGO81376.1 hypothetical protein [Streptomyces mesophilus]